MPDPTTHPSPGPASPPASTEPCSPVLGDPREIAVWAATFVLAHRDGPARSIGTGRSPSNLQGYRAEVLAEADASVVTLRVALAERQSPTADRWTRKFLMPGSRVRTILRDDSHKPERRRWNVSGIVTGVSHDHSPGTRGYRVQHDDDDVVYCYEPRELAVMPDTGRTET